MNEYAEGDYDEAMKYMQYEESRRELTEAEQYLRKMIQGSSMLLKEFDNETNASAEFESKAEVYT